MSGSNSAERKRHEPLVLVETADLSEEDWLDYRRRGIGGSDVSAIFGTSPCAAKQYDYIRCVLGDRRSPVQRFSQGTAELWI